MTQSLNRQNLSIADQINQAEIYDKNGRLDPVASDIANREIFSEANIARLPGGSIDHVVTAVKHAATKTVVLARKN
jgi:hypothetical protein